MALQGVGYIDFDETSYFVFSLLRYILLSAAIDRLQSAFLFCRSEVADVNVWELER